MDNNLQAKLEELEQLISQEREYARTLQHSELNLIQEQKKLLLDELRSFSDPCPPELKSTVSRLRDENRRNARLLWNSLGFLRQSMQSCTQQVMPMLYGRQGNKLQSAAIGILHNGRI